MIQSDLHQVLNTKGKNRQIQLNSHKKNRWQAELAALSKSIDSQLCTLTVLYEDFFPYRFFHLAFKCTFWHYYNSLLFKNLLP